MYVMIVCHCSPKISSIHVHVSVIHGKRFLPNGSFSAFFNDFEIFYGPLLINLHRLLWAIFQVDGTMAHGPLPSQSLMYCHRSPKTVFFPTLLGTWPMALELEILFRRTEVRY